VGKISKNTIWRSRYLLIWHLKYSVISSKIHSYRLLFRRFFPLLQWRCGKKKLSQPKSRKSEVWRILDNVYRTPMILLSLYMSIMWPGKSSLFLRKSEAQIEGSRWSILGYMTRWSFIYHSKKESQEAIINQSM